MTAPQNPRVTAADKQAAEAFWMVHGPFAWGTVATLYEAFARHREAAEATSKAREAALVEALRGLVASVDNLISESGGVYGLHLNGDPSPWSELTEGGRFEEWLIALEAARAALTKEPDA